MKVPAFCDSERMSREFLVNFNKFTVQDDGSVIAEMKCLGMAGHCPKVLYIRFGMEAWKEACRIWGC